MADIDNTCPACGGIGGFLGYLGSFAWLRCIACGMDFKLKARTK